MYCGLLYKIFVLCGCYFINMLYVVLSVAYVFERVVVFFFIWFDIDLLFLLGLTVCLVVLDYGFNVCW